MRRRLELARPRLGGPGGTPNSRLSLIVRTVRACVCRSDLHPYHSLPPAAGGTPMGHELIGVVEETGAAVTSVRKGPSSPGSRAPGAAFAYLPEVPAALTGGGARCARPRSARFEPVAQVKDVKRRFLAYSFPPRSPGPPHLAVLVP